MTDKGNRLLVNVVHDDYGGSEVYWARTFEDVTNNFDGSMLLLRDGSITIRCATDDDTPFVLHLEGNRLRVTLGEDMPPAYGSSSVVVFDSATLPSEGYGKKAE